MIGLCIILAHLVGDYVIQSHWMSLNKTSRWWPAIIHGLTYTVPYAIFVHDWRALAIICVTHIVIDRYRLARHLVWLKNWIGSPPSQRTKWKDVTASGYPPGTPDWLGTWLMIIADNTAHLVLNTFAILLFPGGIF